MVELLTAVSDPNVLLAMSWTVKLPKLVKTTCGFCELADVPLTKLKPVAGVKLQAQALGLLVLWS